MTVTATLLKAPVIEIQRLSRNFGSKVALADVSLNVPKGSVFGLVGANGAGKTTLIKHVLGLLKPTSGSVQTFGYDPTTDQWKTLAPMPHGRHGFGGAAIGANAYFVGGALDPGGAGTTDQLLMFHLP